MTELSSFHKKTLAERLESLKTLPHITPDDWHNLEHAISLSSETADTIIENFIHVYGVPLGIAPNFLIDNKLYHAPMATEEPSVIAAASFGARIIAQSGGFTITQNDRAMVGHISLYGVKNIDETMARILSEKQTIIQRAHNAYPSIVKRGGGVLDVTVAHKKSIDGVSFVVVYLVVDTQEAMGANMLNTMLEAVREYVTSLSGGESLMAILSNFATKSVVTATCRIPAHLLEHHSHTLSGETVRDKIVLAYQFATADIYRATTHNKGIMNGISAVVLASGNDTRAIEAGAHAYASQSGNYQPLTKWEKNESGELVGTISLPLPIGFVGGSITVHPSAKLSQHLSQTQNAKELASLIACVGLAQNFAALRALVSEGIQKGHMARQLKSLALTVGATGDEINELVAHLKQAPIVNQEYAATYLQNMREKATK